MYHVKTFSCVTKARDHEVDGSVHECQQRLPELCALINLYAPRIPSAIDPWNAKGTINVPQIITQFLFQTFQFKLEIQLSLYIRDTIRSVAALTISQKYPSKYLCPNGCIYMANNGDQSHLWCFVTYGVWDVIQPCGLVCAHGLLCMVEMQQKIRRIKKW